MKPLFVKAAALLASPLKRSQAQQPALKEQEGVPFPFAIQQPPPPKKKTKKQQIRHTQKYDRAGPSPLRRWGWGKRGWVAPRGAVVWEVTEDGQKFGVAEKWC